MPLTTYYREQRGFRDGQFPVAERISNDSISIPVGPHLADGDAERIVSIVRDAVTELDDGE